MSHRPNRRRLATRSGALGMLALCFVASAIVRAGDVVAALPTGSDDGFGNPVPAAADAKPASSKDAMDTADLPQAMIAELKSQRKDLNSREERVLAREQKLEALEEKLRKRLAELKRARAKLQETAELVDDAAGKDVAKLAQMYQQMKPKQAGQIFNEMAPSFAAGFISEMRPDAAALIMANMEAEKAYAVSLLLAGRNLKKARQPKE